MATVEKLATNYKLTKDQRGRYVAGQVQYQVNMADSEDDAVNAVRAAAADSWLGMYRNTVACQEKQDIRGSYLVTVAYAYNKAMESMAADYANAKEPARTFEVTGASVHIRQSRNTVAVYTRTGAEPINFYGAIGVTSDGTANGIDINTAVATFTETAYFSPNKFTTDFQKGLMQMYNRVNNSRFRGYEAGELLFLGGSGSQRGNSSDDYWQFDFRFGVQLNEQNYEIGGVMVPQKRGWDVAWPYYEWDMSQGVPLQVVRQVNIEQVYLYDNFKKLGI